MATDLSYQTEFLVEHNALLVSTTGNKKKEIWAQKRSGSTPVLASKLPLN